MLPIGNISHTGPLDGGGADAVFCRETFGGRSWFILIQLLRPALSVFPLLPVVQPPENQPEVVRGQIAAARLPLPGRARKAGERARASGKGKALPRSSPLFTVATGSICGAGSVRLQASACPCVLACVPFSAPGFARLRPVTRKHGRHGKGQNRQ